MSIFQKKKMFFFFFFGGKKQKKKKKKTHARFLSFPKKKNGEKNQVDVCPAEFITAVVTELGPMPPSSVPVVLREFRGEHAPGL